MTSSATSRNVHSMTTCELNYAAAMDPTRGAVPPGKDTMHQILLRRSIPTLMTARETKSTPTPGITIRLGQAAQPITSSIGPKKRTATGAPTTSIGSEEILKRSSGLGGMPESMMGRETATSGGPTTTMTRSIVSTSRSSTGSRRSSSEPRKRRMRIEGSSIQKEMKRLRMP
jgi:hypothetical protein